MVINLNSIMHFIEMLKSNQLLMTLVGVSGAGMVSFWLKDVPKRIYGLLLREFTTELVITNHNVIFYEFMKWIQKNYSNRNFRKLKLSNGIWGSGGKLITSIGFGTHFIRYKGRYFLFTLNKEVANQTSSDKETLIVTTIGRSRKIFDSLIKDVESLKDKDSDVTSIYKYSGSNWSYIKDQTKRSLNSVFIEKEKKDKLIESLTKFINSEQWYVNNGIPYQMGILLYGPPGTGKTSLIKAIASHVDYPIYYLGAQKLSTIEGAVSELPDKCILVIEDIDANNLTHTRSKDITEKKSAESEMVEGVAAISLSEVLNSLDGLFSTHGRILIATTNHIENLDPALIRPGRIDLKVEIGYVNNEIAHYFVKNFFPETKIDSEDFYNYNIKPKLTVAVLQNLILEGKSEDQVMDFICAKSA